MTRRGGRGGLLAVVLFAIAAPGAAQTAPEVALDVPDCLGVKGDEVEKLVALELEPRMRVVGSATASSLVGRVGCREGAPVELRVEDPERGAPLRSELDLARTAAPARTRLLALALAELIATSRLERAGTGTGTGAETGTGTGTGAGSGTETDSETDSEIDIESGAEAGGRDPWLLWVGPALSISFAPTTPLFGADIGAARELGPFAIQAELGARFGTATVPDADVAMQNYSAALGIGPAIALGDVDLFVGAGVRGGYARLSAFPTRADRRGAVVDGAFFGPMAMAAATIGAFGPSRLRVALEAGVTTRSVVGQDVDDSELVAMRGAWLSCAVALGLGL